MSYFILEIKVICVEGLEEFNLISSPNLSVYVMVILKGASLKDQEAKTNMVEGTQNPSWNYAMKFFIDRSKHIQALKSHLMFTIISKNNEEHKKVGQINVPILDLLRVFQHQNSLQDISFSIQKISSGHTINGKFRFAFKFEQPEAQQQSPRMSSLLSQSPSTLQSSAKEQEESVKKRGRWKGIVTKLIMGLVVSVGGGFISRIIFEHGHKAASSSTNNSLPSSSNTFVSPNSFDDNQAPPNSTCQDTATVAIDPTTASFYNDDLPLATFSDTDAHVTSDLAMSFYRDDLPLTEFPYNAASVSDPTTSSNGFSDAPIDDVDYTTSYDGDSSTILDSVVGVFSSFG